MMFCGFTFYYLSHGAEEGMRSFWGFFVCVFYDPSTHFRSFRARSVFCDVFNR